MFVLIKVWFYEHTTRYDTCKTAMYPRIGRWPDVYHGGRYDAFDLVAGIEENEVRETCYRECGECVVVTWFDCNPG